MATARTRAPARVAAAAILAVAFTAAPAENMDPDDLGWQYAWGENVGWINTEPTGDGGPGMEVEDFRVSGWLWGENVGWISLTCENEGVCDAAPYRVRNDGTGALSGQAWGENVGWISFAGDGWGVTVTPADGIFFGHAWGENVGWISFNSTGPNAFRIRTAWSCFPPPPIPGPTSGVVLEKVGSEVALGWAPVEGATGYDVVHGDLAALRAGGGDFAAAVLGCVADNVVGSGAADAEVPPPGAGFWYLVRGASCSGAGTYDTLAASQVVPRDEGIAGSGADCRMP